MKLKPLSDNLDDYLVDSYYLDYHSDNIKETASRIFKDCNDELEKARAAFIYVRDSISHSFDINAEDVTITASEVLESGHGICYAKSNLLASLLRGAGIPSGFCYQRLRLFDSVDSKFCIHALNAVYLKQLNRFIRLDARGNKNGINAQFSTDKEYLAFNINVENGEIDYPTIYSAPLDITMIALKNSKNCRDLINLNLPQGIDG